MMARSVIVLAFMLIMTSMVLSQSETCSELVETALATVQAACEMTDRNQACYGNVAVSAEFQPDVTNFRFEQSGDIVDLAAIHSLTLQPLDETAGTWGVALLRLQASLPDTLPGQNVTFILFGDTVIENAATDQQNPMQAFYLKSGIGDSTCASAPESGLLVQTPAGVGEVRFNINGIDVAVGSTVMFQATPSDRMIVRTIEGAATLTIDGFLYPVIAGTQLQIPIDDDFSPDMAQISLMPYDLEQVESLPITLLERSIEIADPLTEAQVDELLSLLDSGEAICSDNPASFLPVCGEVPVDLGGYTCGYDPAEGLPLCQVMDALYANCEGIECTALSPYLTCIGSDCDVLLDAISSAICENDKCNLDAFAAPNSDGITHLTAPDNPTDSNPDDTNSGSGAGSDDGGNNSSDNDGAGSDDGDDDSSGDDSSGGDGGE